MKNLTPLFKTSFALLLLALGSIFYINNALSHAEEKVYRELTQKLTDDLDHEEKFMEKIGITNAILIADNERIKKAIMDDDREAAIHELKIISDKFHESTRIKDLKIHIHTADVKSYIRNWKLDKYGDDLSGFRKTILKVKETRSPVFSFEVGRIGLTLRSIVPIMDGVDYLGSLEFIQAFDNVPKNFEKKGNHHLLLMNDSLLYIASYLKKAPSIDHYKLSSKYYNQVFFESAQALDIDAVVKKGFLLTDQYMFTYKYITDMNNNNVGIHLLGMPTEEVHKAIEEEEKSIWMISALCAVLFFLTLVFMIVVQRNKKE